ncbi:ATP-binding protein [Kineococcus sp. R8]|uniref:ATP-binding protein n=1 Tax=Kineococcus siccus TaxID=2696567 RepID=UPI0014129A0A|nr:ATP-binding protein [Kineococcus siccus]NAZ82815.1 ATP-binding protein [Kineococcus siccus]
MCDDTPLVEVRLPADLSAARHARSFLRTSLCAHQTRVMDRALLLFSEMAVNAVEHGDPPVTATLDCGGVDGVRLAVHDGSRVRPVRHEVGPEAESGRGVNLVDVLSDQWGVDVDADGRGKTVWCRLRP